MDCEILHVVGARPNFVKMAPVYKSLKNLRVTQKILHSGQHYDKNMSDDFFEDLGIPKPDKNLNVKGKTHAEQTGFILVGVEKFLTACRPKIVCVYGDINTTLAAAISAKKLGIKIAHIESGLRSRDITMPEEQNRIMTDSISDIHFVTEKAGLENLAKEGKKDSCYFVGNTMIDSLKSLVDSIDVKKDSDYGVVTFHRPSNVDSKERLQKIIQILEEIKSEIYWPVHPRTLSALKKFRCLSRVKRIKGLKMIDPLSYNSFISLVKNSKFVITDSGGIQEETTYMGVPCITYRDSTERPSTVLEGTNILTMSKDEIIVTIKKINLGIFKKSNIPELWDGNAGERISLILKKKLLLA